MDVTNAIEYLRSRSKACREKSAEVIVPDSVQCSGKDRTIGGVISKWKPDMELSTDNFISRTT